MLPKPLKERLDEGREMRRGKENAFGDRDVDLFFIENEEGRGDSSLRALPALSNKKIPARPGKALATTEKKGSM